MPRTDAFRDSITACINLTGLKHLSYGGVMPDHHWGILFLSFLSAKTNAMQKKKKKKKNRGCVEVESCQIITEGSLFLSFFISKNKCHAKTKQKTKKGKEEEKYRLCWSYSGAMPDHHWGIHQKQMPCKKKKKEREREREKRRGCVQTCCLMVTDKRCMLFEFCGPSHWCGQ